MSIFSNLKEAKAKASGNNSSFFEGAGSFICSVKSTYKGQIKKDRNKGQWFALIEFTIDEVKEGSLIPGEVRKTYYALGYPGSGESKHVRGNANIMRDLASLAGLDLADFGEEAGSKYSLELLGFVLEAFFEEDGAAVQGSTCKIDVTAVEKGEKTYYNTRLHGIEPRIPAEAVIQAAQAAQAAS